MTYEKIILNKPRGHIDLTRQYKNLYINNPNKIQGEIVLNHGVSINPFDIDLIENIPGGVKTIDWDIPGLSANNFIILYASNAFLKPHELTFKVEEALPVDVTNAQIDVNVNNATFTIIPEAASSFRVYPQSNSTWSVDITNSLLDVNITNSILYIEQVENSVWDINVTNSNLNVTIQNNELDVNITNSVLDTNITNSVIIVDQVDNSVWDINVTNSELAVNVTNSVLNTNITNSVIVVDQADSTVWDINVTNSLLAVDVQNSVIYVEQVQNSVWDINVTNSSLDVNITNTVLDINVTNSVVDVNISGTASVSIDEATITLDSAIAAINTRWPAQQLEYEYSALFGSRYADMPWVVTFNSSGDFELLNVPSWESIPVERGYLAVGFSKPLVRLQDSRHAISAIETDNTTYSTGTQYNGDDFPETDLLTIDYGEVINADFEPWLYYHWYNKDGADSHAVNLRIRIYYSTDGTNWTQLDEISYSEASKVDFDIWTYAEPLYRNITFRYIKYTASITNYGDSDARIDLKVQKHFIWRLS